MSKEIDEKVVSMEFDNSKFEKNVSTSMSTIEKLKQSLNFKGAEKSFDAIDSASKRVDMSGLAGAIETVNTKFSALQVIGVTALANLTNSAVEAGKRIISSFTIEPITTGFNEYELKMGSIQTIMASTGESLETVNGYLDDLNTYSDRTIYSFSDMTQSIGKFTNAGVKLDDAVVAIKGISNEAAISGANADEASRAMYNFAQALSAGYVKLIDWKSIEMANMATVEFKTQLLEAAVAAGTLTKTAGGMYETIGSGTLIDATHNFNDSLQEQWMTTDVLVNTLRDYADETTEIGKKAYAAAQDVKTFSQLMDTLKEAVQSGWAETWQIIVGDFTEAKDIFTRANDFFSDLVAKSAKARNTFTAAVMATPWEQLTSKVNDAGISVSKFQEALIETAKKHGIAIDDMIEKEGSFENTLKNGWLTKDLVKETLLSFIDNATGVSGATEDMTDKFKDLQSIVDQVIHGDFQNGHDRVLALTDAGYDYATVQGLVNERLLGTKMEIKDLSDEQLKNIGYTDDQVKVLRDLADEADKTGTQLSKLIENMQRPSGRELVVETFLNAAKGIAGVIQALQEAWASVFPPEEVAEKLYLFIDKLHTMSMSLSLIDDTTGKLNDDGEKLKRTFSGVFAIVDLATDAFGGTAKVLFNLSREIFNALGLENVKILDITASIGDSLVAFKDWVFAHDLATNAFKTLAPHIVVAAKAIGNLTTEIYNSEFAKNIISNFEVVLSGFCTILDKTATFLEKTAGKFVLWIKSLKDIPVVAENLENISSVCKTLYENIKRYFGDAVKYVEAFFDAFSNIGDFNLSNVEAAFRQIKEATKDLFSGDLFSGISDDMFSGFLKGLEGGASNVYAKMKDFAEGILETVKAILGIHSPSTKFAEIGENIVNGLCNGIQASGKKVIDTISSLASYLLTIVRQIDWDHIFVGVMTAFSGVIIYKIVGIVEKFSKVFEGLYKIFDAVSDSIRGLAHATEKYIGAKSLKLKSDAILNIAKAIAILAASVLLISKIEPAQLWAAIGAITVLIGELIAASKLAEKIDIASIGKLSLLVLAVSISLGIMAKSVAMLAKDVKPGDAFIAIGEMATMMLVLSGALVIFGRFVKENSADVDKAGVMLLALSVAIAIMAHTLKVIANMTWEDISKGMIVLTGIIGLFMLVVIASKFAGENGDKAGTMLLKMSVAIGIMALVVKTIASMTTEEIDKGLRFIEKCLFMFEAVVLVSLFAGKNGDKAGNMLLKMSIAIGVLALTVKLVSSMSSSDLIKGGAFIAGCLLLFKALVKVSEFAGDNGPKAGTMLLKMAVAIGILAISAKLAGSMDINELVRGTFFVSAMMALYVAVVKVSNYAGANASKAGSMLLKMSAAILIMVGSIAILSFIDPKDVVRGTLCISLIMGMFSLLALSMKNLKIDNSTFKGLIVISAALGIVTASIAVIASINPDNLLPAVLSLSTLLTALAVSLKIISSCGTISKSAIVALGEITIILIALTAVLWAIDALNINASLQTVLGLSALLVALSGCCLILSLVPASGCSAGILALAELVGGLLLIVGILGGVNEVTNGKLKEFLDSGIPILNEIGYALGSFLGNIIGGFVGSALAGIGGMGVELSDFMSSMEPFIEGTKNIDESSVNGVKALAETILILTAADLLNGIASFFGIKSSISDFAASLEPLGIAMGAYGAAVSGISPDIVTASANAAKAIAELTTSLPREDGWMDAIIGQRMSLGDLADQLAPFGAAMVDYSNSIVNLNPDAVTASAEAAKTISDLVTSLPREDGWMDIIVGQRMSLGDLASQLVPFGQSMMEYSNSVANLNPEVVTASANAAKVISDLATGLPNQGGIVSWFTGDNTLVSFGEQLATFGPKFASYYDSISGININTLSASVSELKHLLSVAEGFADIDTSKMGSFGTSLKKLADVGIDKFIEAFDSAEARITKAAEKMVDTFADGADGCTENLSSAFSRIVNSVLDGLESDTDSFNRAGSKLMESFINGIDDKKSSLSDAIGDAVEDGSSEAEGYYSDFYDAGGYVIQGFADGIDTWTNIWKVRNAVARVANQAATQARVTLDINSPSKVFYKIGEYTSQGFVNGIRSLGDEAGNAGFDVAENAKIGLQNAISKITDVIDGNLDASPVIRPVLDLSNVQNGASRIGSLLDAKHSYSLTSSIDSDGVLNRSSGQVAINMVVNGAPGQDINQLADVVINKITTSMGRRENAWR